METATYNPTDHMLSPLCEGWRGKIKRAREHKEPFDRIAEECMAFLCDSHEFLWDPKSKFRLKQEDGEEFKPPSFQMTVNKAHELRALFGPVLYSRNPVRTVTPREPFSVPQELMIDPNLVMQISQLDQAAAMNPLVAQDPMFVMQYQQLQMTLQQQQMAFQAQQMQAQQTLSQDKVRADLLQRVLNYTPNELDLAGNASKAIDEALIKGGGVMWTEMYEPPGSQRRLPGSFYDTIDNLLADPDAEEWKDCKWVARRCQEPYWEVERDRGLPADSLKKYATMESGRSQGERAGDSDANNKRANQKTNDTLTYWKIYSKMGMGGRMAADMPDDLREKLEGFGDFCYLEICEGGCPYPLNMPDEKIDVATDEDLDAMVRWPLESWRDDRWPFEMIEFYRKPRYLWPISPLAPGLGELKFINWCMSYLAGRVKSSCRTFIAMAKAAAQEIEDSIVHGPDFTIFKIAASDGPLTNVVDFLNQPEVNKDVWSVLSAVMEMFDKRVGLTELVYGMSSRQMRSASEANVKAESISVRPDYMAGKVEQAMSELARREAFALRQLDGAEVSEIVGGPIGAQWWDLLVKTDDMDTAAREFDVRVEAGSARRPNRERDVDNMSQVLPVLLPIYQQYAAVTGNYQPFNALTSQWFSVIQKDATGLMLPDVQMMPQPMPGQEGGEQEGEQPEGKAA